MNEKNPDPFSDDELSDEFADELSRETRPAFQDNLRAAFQTKESVDVSVDQQIIASAKRHLQSIGGVKTKHSSPNWLSEVVRHSRTKWLVSAAVVAAALLLLMNWRFQDQNAEVITASNARSRVTELAKEDLDQNGQVDILDAFFLAKQLRQGQADAAWDLNQDGRIDQVDVEHAAMLAVKLPPRETKG